MVGIVVNTILAFLTYHFGLPIYLDTVGTITVSAVAGMFPGILTAVLSNLLCSIFNDNALYYSIISVLVAVATAWFVDHHLTKKKSGLLIYILVVAFISGALGMCFQWLLAGGPQFDDVHDAAKLISSGNGVMFFVATLIVNFGLNIVDKGISSALAIAAIKIIPPARRHAIKNSGWKQTPPTKYELGKANKDGGKSSVQGRVSLMLAVLAICLTLVVTGISIKLYYSNTKKEYEKNAINAAKFVSAIVDGNRIDDYIKEGKEAEGYLETEQLMYHIRDNAPGVKYLYVVKINQKDCTYVFDLDTEDEPAMQPGEKTPFEEAFEQYIPTLFAGKEIDPIESDDISGWVLTAYYPIKNSSGETVCYAGADVSMELLSGYAKDFFIKTLLIFSGFFVLILGYGFTVSGYYIVYPIKCMTECAKEFIKGDGEQAALDKSVKRIKSLNISTDDEVQELYESICKMEADMTEHVRDIRHYADATAKMQNGLIITMADMVENRDSDTGAHIQKTAAYVRIILEGLKAKGYYADKLTEKYMSDCEMSAPLHDVGKINIPDAVLNKPGKLTEEEYAIMKTHTTAGKKIMENAISTVSGENYLKEARNMAAYHHERWDGKGYPEGLYGEVIPLAARVMAVADVFDALTSPRVYKPAFPLDKALSIIQEGAGTQFDPKCVEVFMENLTEVKIILKKYNNQDY
jgi:response regulator RpfG family c-di-GMP phosphodiesterase